MRFLKRTIAVFLLPLSAFLGCGDGKSQYDVEQKVSGVTWPTTKNYARWQNLWDGHSWIVALSREEQRHKDKSFLNQQMFDSLLRAMRKRDPGFTGAETLKYQMNGILKTRLLAISNFEKKSVLGHPPLPVFGFATLTFRGGLSGFEQLLRLSSVWEGHLANFEASAKNEFLLNFLWSALEDTPGIEFAEPDLESEIQRDVGQVQNVIKSNRNVEILGLADLLTPMTSAGKAVVAVVDTGVDSGLDAAGKALENRLYRNPGEDPEKGKKPFEDDDGNGWIDDYIGVNANISKGETDNSPPPIPGSNDIGGQGATCEPGTDKSSSSCGHGTHVAGIIAGFAQGQTANYVGTCPYNCIILPIRAARRCFGPRNSTDSTCQPAEEAASFNRETQREFDGGITDSSQLRSFAYILDLESPSNPGKLVTNVVNLSIGKYFSSRALSLVSRRLVQNDVLLVAAAGNQNVEVPMFPAAYRDVISVCATSKTGSEPNEPTGSSSPSKGSAPVRGERLKARFSNFGDWVDICAPGSFITSSVPGGELEQKSGTSQASPHVSGIAGALKALRPSLSAMDIRNILIRFANFPLLYGPLENGRNANEDFAYSPYPDVKVFLLGSGMLSANNAYFSLFDASKAVVSQASSAIDSGDTSQVSSGCIVSSLAAHHPQKNLERSTSLPVVLLLTYGILRLFSRKRKRPGY